MNEYNLKIEQYKQRIINAFQKNNLFIKRLRKASDEKGIFIYHSLGTEYQRTYRKLVEKLSESEYLYQRIKKNYNVDFIGIENEEDFKDSLDRIIIEAKNRIK